MRRSSIYFVIILCGIMFFSCQKKNEFTTELVDVENQANAISAPTNPLFEIDSVGKQVQFFTETYSVASQRQRLKLRITPSQMLPTGFVAEPNSTITLNVTVTEGSRAPTIMIGTYERGTDRHTVQQTPLTSGANSVFTAGGGIIWIVYVNSAPNSKATVTFTSGHHPLPVFIKNKTSLSDWQQQLTDYNTNNDVLMIGQRVYMVYDKDLHANVATQDNNEILETADFVFDAEDDFSGLDGSAPEHTRLIIPHLMAHNSQGTSPGAMSATNFRTVYPTAAARANVFVAEGISKSWGVWHEFGHMHQQDSYHFEGLTEVTVNLYSLAAERALGITPNRLQRDNRWPPALAHLANTDPNKSFNSLDVWHKLVMFHQLWLAYGDNFYKQLHKLTREDSGTYSTDDSKLKNFAIKSCEISGHDLTAFFQKWGIRDALNMYDAIDALSLPAPTIDPSTLTDD